MEVVTTCSPSERGVLGIGMGHSVLEVRSSFHSKHVNYEGITVWVCGGGGKDVSLLLYYLNACFFFLLSHQDYNITQ